MRVPATPPIFLPVQAWACTDDMAAQAGESGRVEEERDVMKEAEENLASVKNTLAAIDDLYKRWEVYYHNVIYIITCMTEFQYHSLQ